MPITVEEFYTSRSQQSGPSAFVDMVYIVRGDDDDEAVMAAVAAEAEDEMYGLPRQEIRLEPQGDPTIWLATAHYAAAANTASGSSGGRRAPTLTESVYSFDTGGGTQHITQSLGTVASYAAAGTAPNFGGAIGVSRDGVAGVDVPVPVFHFSEEHVIAAADVDDDYKNALFSLTGCMNGGTFRGLAAGECLFMGASGTKRGDGDWQITFKFAALANATDIAVGGITVAAKLGWDYMWVYYEQTTSEGRIGQAPAAVYVERVHRVGDFSTLGI